MSSYYCQIREELLKKAHDKYHKKGGKERANNITKKTKR